ncbi:hypothetical protein MTO96_002270 [Rhipicephalus appendiculatus]
MQVPLPEQCPNPVTVEATWWAIGTIIFGVIALILLLPCFVWTALRGGPEQRDNAGASWCHADSKQERLFDPGCRRRDISDAGGTFCERCSIVR